MRGCEHQIHIPGIGTCCEAYYKSKRSDGKEWMHFPFCKSEHCPLDNPELLEGAVLDETRDATTLLIKAVDEALNYYGRDIISVDRDDITGKFDINQCHGSWSDVIAMNVADPDDIDMGKLIAALDERRIGYCL